MRIKITFKNQTPQKIGYNYNQLITGLIYKSIEQSNEKLSKILHDKGFLINNQKFKMFVFSNLIPIDKNFNFRHNYIEVLPGKIELYVSSSIDEVITNFADGIYSSKTITLSKKNGYNDYNLKLDIDNIEIVKPPKFTKRVLYKTLSFYTNTTQTKDLSYHTPPLNSKLFLKLMKNNIIKKYKIIYRDYPDDFKIIYNKFKPNELKGKLINISYNNKIISIKCYNKAFVIEGDKKIHKIVYDNGFGSKNTYGFGMVDILY